MEVLLMKRFHLTPFRHYWQRDSTDFTTVEQVHGELFSSDSFALAYEEIQNLPAMEGCTLERSVCALMFWSDSTNLADFGTAALWPIYMFFGNESKYTRGTMSINSSQHLAYIPKVRAMLFALYM
jgi:hypothetical protein